MELLCMAQVPEETTVIINSSYHLNSNVAKWSTV